MNFDFTEEQTMIKDSVSRFVRDEYDFDTRRSIIESDGGLAALPDYVADGTDLVRVLPDSEGPVITAYFVYPEEMRSTKRIKVLRDFLVKKVAASTFDRNS